MSSLVILAASVLRHLVDKQTNRQTPVKTAPLLLRSAWITSVWISDKCFFHAACKSHRHRNNRDFFDFQRECHRAYLLSSPWIRNCLTVLPHMGPRNRVGPLYESADPPTGRVCIYFLPVMYARVQTYGWLIYTLRQSSGCWVRRPLCPVDHRPVLYTWRMNRPPVTGW